MTKLADMDAATQNVLEDSWFGAARLGNLDDLRTMLENYPELLELKDRRDQAPALVLAAESGHLRSVKFLVESGADIHAADSADRNALYAAAQNARAVIAEYLIDQGLDPYDEGEVDLSPIGIAQHKGYGVVADHMRDTREKFNAAARKAHEEDEVARARKVDAIGAQVKSGTNTHLAAPKTARFTRKS